MKRYLSLLLLSLAMVTAHGQGITGTAVDQFNALRNSTVRLTDYTSFTGLYALTLANQNVTIAGKLTKAQADGFYKASSYQPTFATLPDKPTIPTLPTVVSAFTNDRNYQVPADVAAKPDLATVTTFTLAKTLVTAGKPKAFIITADEAYGASFTVWDGSNYFVLPLIPRPVN